MTQKPYKKEHAENLLIPCAASEQWEITERGVSPKPQPEPKPKTGETQAVANQLAGYAPLLSWRPAVVFKDDTPAPDLINTPSLPFPFDARDLAVFMLNGVGSLVADFYGEWDDGPDKLAIDEITPLDPFARQAVTDAYVAYREAQEIVGPYPSELDNKAERARKAWGAANKDANQREGVFDSEPRTKESTASRERAKAATAALEEEMKTAAAEAKAAHDKWLEAMVRELLKPAPAANVDEQKKQYLDELIRLVSDKSDEFMSLEELEVAAMNYLYPMPVDFVQPNTHHKHGAGAGPMAELFWRFTGEREKAWAPHRQRLERAVAEGTISLRTQEHWDTKVLNGACRMHRGQAFEYLLNNPPFSVAMREQIRTKVMAEVVKREQEVYECPLMFTDRLTREGVPDGLTYPQKVAFDLAMALHPDPTQQAIDDMTQEELTVAKQGIKDSRDKTQSAHFQEIIERVHDGRIAGIDPETRTVKRSGWYFYISIEDARLYCEGLLLPVPECLRADSDLVTPERPTTISRMGLDAGSGKKLPAWLDVTGNYIAGIMRGRQIGSAKLLYRELETKAGPESPFDKGTGQNRGRLYVREIGATVSLKTMQNNWELLQSLGLKGKRNAVPAVP